MGSSRDLARIITLSQKCDAKVVLVGDHAQLDAVEAGGLFRLLANDSNVAELTNVRRFANPWEADASLRLRQRDPKAIRSYDEHDRIVGGDRPAMLDQAFDRWQHARDAGESVIVCARDHDTVDAFNQRARDERVAAGTVQADGVTVGEQTIGVGDEIVTTRNDRSLVTMRDGWVRNGDRWTIRTHHPDGSLTVDDATGRGRVTLPAGYVAEHVALAYAVTIHKAQGVTVDHAILIADQGISAEALYVGMTRGRHDNTALVVTDPVDLDRHHRQAPLDPAAVLVNALGRDTGERSAIDELRHTLERSESLAVLKPRLANLDHWLKANTPVDRSIDLERARRKLAGFENNARPGRITRAGRDDRRTLDALTARVRDLDQHEERRDAWITDNLDTFDYRAELADTVKRRALHLGRVAAVDQPGHLTTLLGAYPDRHPARDRWIFAAARVEAYREEWAIDPDDLHRRPTDSVQQSEWNLAVDRPRHAATLEHRSRHQQTQRAAQREIEVEHDHGIEL